MSDSTSPELEAWQVHLQECLDPAWFHQVVVRERVGSTQDVVRGHGQGVIATARHQVDGRGRLGRTWTQRPGLGVAVSFGLDRTKFEDGHLALIGGLASCMTIEGFGLEGRVGLRWPNDVVEVRTGAKLSGVLVETQDDLAIVGIGINISHAPGDFPEDLHATSLHAIGGNRAQIEVLEHLIRTFCTTLRLDPSTIVEDWSRRDVLLGTHQVFLHRGERVEGEVLAILPASSITVRAASGIVTLPAATTSLVH